MAVKCRVVNHPCARRGMTLVELLLAAMMTAVISAAAATLLSGASNASAQSRNARSVTAAGHYAESRIGAVIRQARGIGQVTATRVSLWMNDANDDDTVQLSESAVIYYDSSAKAIAIDQTDSTATAAATTAVSRTTFQDVTLMTSAIRGVTFKSTQWAEDVQACAFDGFPNLTDTRVVNATFMIGTGSDATEFAVTASPKAPGDYLFQTSTRAAPSGSETRFTRTRVSPYTGASTAQ